MNCSNCGNTLNENSKFCPKCGNPVSEIGTNANQQTGNMAVSMQQPIYNAKSTGVVPKKHNVITIILGIAVAVMIVILISMQSTITDLENDLYRAQDKMEEYENRDPLEKSIDAIGSWLY